MKIFEENAGLHFTALIPENADMIIEKGGECGVRITPLEAYYADKSQCRDNLYLVNYAGAVEEKLSELVL